MTMRFPSKLNYPFNYLRSSMQHEFNTEDFSAEIERGRFVKPKPQQRFEIESW